MKRTRLAQLAASCFRDSAQPGFVSAANGDLMSAFEFVISAYQQSLALQLSGGSGRVSAGDNKKSKLGAASLQSVLEAMLVDIRTSPLGSIDEVTAKWSPRLLHFNNGNFKVGDFVIQALKNCFDRAQKQIAKEMADPSTELGVALRTLQQMRSINPNNPDLQEMIKAFEK